MTCFLLFWFARQAEGRSWLLEVEADPREVLPSLLSPDAYSCLCRYSHEEEARQESELAEPNGKQPLKSNGGVVLCQIRASAGAGSPTGISFVS